jgi:hypothetical protein
MKIEKMICDICGNEITESHPTRLERQEYDKTSCHPAYKKVGTYDICKECDSKLNSLFKDLKEGK